MIGERLLFYSTRDIIEISVKTHEGKNFVSEIQCQEKIFELVGFLHESVIKCHMIFIKYKYRKTHNTQTIMIFHAFIEHIPLNNRRELGKK